MSRHHATVVCDGSTILLVDQASTNGTYVDGKRVDRIALDLGSEVQFGGGGPKAVLIDSRVESNDSSVVRNGGSEPTTPSKEGITLQVRRLVQDALATSARPSRGRWIVAGIGVVAVAGLASSALVALGLVGEPANERRLDRWHQQYRDAVVLVEVGVLVEDSYQTLGWGTGFVADSNGLIITNKHVIHGHKYAETTACLAESFRRRGLPFEDALTVTVWRGGSRFRQEATAEQGDRQLGFSTEHGSLQLVALATDTYADAATQDCIDPFSGVPFQFEWRRHLQDNSDLALLRASEFWPGIPLADADPTAGDPVMVLGFPSALTPLETPEAEPIARNGEVLRTQETVLIDAVVLGGNSGGPLINVDGEVVGVATRGISGLLNMGIKTRYVRELIEHSTRTAPS